MKPLAPECSHFSGFSAVQKFASPKLFPSPSYTMRCTYPDRLTLKIRVEAEMMQKKVRKSANGSARSMPYTTTCRHDESSRCLKTLHPHSHKTLAENARKITPTGHNVLESSIEKYPPE
eukprot:6179319-Pleurochrysis_carterae.AAC.4